MVAYKSDCQNTLTIVENTRVIKEAIETIVGGQSLSFEQAAGVMEEIMSGEATPSQIAAFIMALRVNPPMTDNLRG